MAERPTEAGQDCVATLTFKSLMLRNHSVLLPSASNWKVDVTLESEQLTVEKIDKLAGTPATSLGELQATIKQGLRNVECDPIPCHHRRTRRNEPLQHSHRHEAVDQEISLPIVHARSESALRAQPVPHRIRRTTDRSEGLVQPSLPNVQSESSFYSRGSHDHPSAQCAAADAFLRGIRLGTDLRRWRRDAKLRRRNRLGLRSARIDRW